MGRTLKRWVCSISSFLLHLHPPCSKHSSQSPLPCPHREQHRVCSGGPIGQGDNEEDSSQQLPKRRRRLKRSDPAPPTTTDVDLPPSAVLHRQAALGRATAPALRSCLLLSSRLVFLLLPFSPSSAVAGSWNVCFYRQHGGTSPAKHQQVMPLSSSPIVTDEVGHAHPPQSGQLTSERLSPFPPSLATQKVRVTKKPSATVGPGWKMATAPPQNLPSRAAVLSFDWQGGSGARGGT